MHSLEKKARRLNPVIELKKSRFDAELAQLNVVRQRKIEVVAAMRATQKQYMDGVGRLNDERGTMNRLMLEALETGLDNVKGLWMKLYQDVLDLEKIEKQQAEIMSRAHRELEAIQSLQDKYKLAWTQELDKREQKMMDEHAQRKFYR
jgi:flagellar export protein FliJ